MSLLILDTARQHYPHFHIPMVHLPATISNNVPVTEFSLGCDTSLNALVDACDAIKQSASASRNRVFVVETQGGKCGYIATMGGLAVSVISISLPCLPLSLWWRWECSLANDRGYRSAQSACIPPKAGSR